MTITGAIRKIETACSKSGLTNDFHIFEKRVCPKGQHRDKKESFKLTEYLSVGGLIELLNKVKNGEIAKDNDFIELFSNMTHIIHIIENKDTNIFWLVEQ